MKKLAFILLPVFLLVFSTVFAKQSDNVQTEVASKTFTKKDDDVHTNVVSKTSTEKDDSVHTKVASKTSTKMDDDVHTKVASKASAKKAKKAKKDDGVNTKVSSKTSAEKKDGVNTKVTSKTSTKKDGGGHTKGMSKKGTKKDDGGSHHEKGDSHHHKKGDGVQILKTKATKFPPISSGGGQFNPEDLQQEDEEEEELTKAEKELRKVNIGEEESTETVITLQPVDKSKIHVPILRNGEPKPYIEFDPEFVGSWDIQNENVGVSAMQMQLMPNNKAVWFDTTTLGPSAARLQGVDLNNCPISFETNQPDCFAHAVAYNIENGAISTLKIDGDPWCSSGGLGPNGDLIGTGGNQKGTRTVRIISPCDNCEFKERHNALGVGRCRDNDNPVQNGMYSTQQILEDGSIIVVGGRNEFSYDLMQPSLDFTPKVFNLPFLKETTEPALHTDRVPYENNLYPFVYLAPDGNVFLFANNRSILFNPYNGQTIKEYPPLAGGARNYPPSGMSALLPFKLDKANPDKVDAEVVVCGGNHPFAFGKVDKKHTNEKVFLPALQDCWRLKIHDPNPQWVREQDMPHRRTMADLLHLPTGDLLFINGAQNGTSGWEDAEEPNLVPVLYRPYKPMGQRFMELQPTNFPRMYHSSSALLPRGNVLVAGSNPHQFYTFNGSYPTELRVELFWPPYIDPVALEAYETRINEEASTKKFKYGEKLTVSFSFTYDSPVKFAAGELKVTMIAPPFTTHGFCMNQRMLILALEDVKVNPDENVKGVTVTALAPASGKIAPPGYYMLFVVFRGVPSPGIWVHVS